MRYRWRSLLSGGLVLAGAASVFGGWASVTVDDIPEYAVENRAFDLRYTVRRHGYSVGDAPMGKVVLSSGSRTVAVNSHYYGEGVYGARVSFPAAGRWEMKVETGLMGGEMLPLNVIAANAPAPAPMSPYDRGHQLYLAKGCATCHSHQLTRNVMGVRAGPDLSEPKFAAAYLARFLADPSVKSDWSGANRMPNLGLREAEINALTAFLSHTGRKN